MQRRSNLTRLVHLLLVGAIFATFVVAGDPWKEKPYTEWTAKDVKKVLEKSPWSKIVVQRRWSLPGRDAGPQTNSELGSRASTRREEYSRTESIQTSVRWASSRTVREAWRRRAQIVTATGAKVDVFGVVVEDDLSGSPTLDEGQGHIKIRILSVYQTSTRYSTNQPTSGGAART